MVRLDGVGYVCVKISFECRDEVGLRYAILEKLACRQTGLQTPLRICTDGAAHTITEGSPAGAVVPCVTLLSWGWLSEIDSFRRGDHPFPYAH